MKENNVFRSVFKRVGSVELPAFSGVRWMMMPFRLDDLDTVPHEGYRHVLRKMITMAENQNEKKSRIVGTAYLTVDEAVVNESEHHRRPGLHVDGIGPDGSSAGWGGGGGGWGSGGFMLVSSHIGCAAWEQKFQG